jgi:hypothetical protein
VEARLRALEAERQAVLSAEVAQIRAGLRLQELADARDQERLVGDRIRAALAQTLQRLQDDELAGARGSLAGLKAILGEPVMQENPGLRERLPVDLLVAEALTERGTAGSPGGRRRGSARGARPVWAGCARRRGKPSGHRGTAVGARSRRTGKRARRA